MEERWNVFVDGQSLERVVDVTTVAAFLDPACTCGDLCMGQYRFWYERGGTLFTVDVDRIRLDWALDELLGDLPAGGFGAAPQMVRDWSRGEGWCGTIQGFGTVVTADDIQAFADAVAPYIDVELAPALQDLASRAAALQTPMNAMID